MTTTVLLNLGILAFVLMTGLGTCELDRRRFSLPLAIVAVVGARPIPAPGSHEPPLTAVDRRFRDTLDSRACARIVLPHRRP